MVATRYGIVVKLQVIRGEDYGLATVDNPRGDLAMPMFNRTMTPCQVCDAPVWATPSMRAKGRGKFCSQRCAGFARSFSPDLHFWPKVDQSGGPDACWPWLGGFDSDGYGLCGSANGRAHKVAWVIANNCPIPEGAVIRHLCPGGGNRWCCNPRHVTDGTPKQNTADAIAAGRHAHGERVNTAKLTADQVREIRRRRAAGELLADLGHEFGINQSTVSQIAHRRSWRHVA